MTTGTPSPLRTVRRFAAALALLCASAVTPTGVPAALSCRSHWVGSWAASPSGASFITLSHQTVRMIVAPHLGGRRLRIRLSNRFGTTPVTLDGVKVGRRGMGAAITGANRTVRFARQRAVTIPPGGEVLSDPVNLRFAAFQGLAISVFVAGVVASPTEHFITRQTSYRTPAGTGDHTGDPGAAAFSETTSLGVFSTGWYFLTGIDVRAGGRVGAVVTLGDSITDGFQGDPTGNIESPDGIDANDRYPDALARRLIDAGRPSSVLNAGISGNRILEDGLPLFGPSGLSRLEQDVVAQAGVTDVIVLEGINDIGMTPATEAQVVAGLGQILDALHGAGLRVLLGTLTPAGGTAAPGYGGAAVNLVRQQVNDWIRTQQVADGVVDFDAALRDAQDPSRLDPAFDSSDHLHPSQAGYQAMADAVDLGLLTHDACAALRPSRGGRGGTDALMARASRGDGGHKR